MPKRYGKTKNSNSKSNSKSRSNYKRKTRKMRKSRKMRKGGCGSTSCSNAGSSLSTAGKWVGGADDAMNNDLYKHYTDNSPYRSSK